MLTHYVRHFYCDGTISTRKIENPKPEQINFPDGSYCCYFFNRRLSGDGKTLEGIQTSGMNYKGTEFTLDKFNKTFGKDNRYKDFIIRCRARNIDRIVVTNCGRVNFLTKDDKVYS